MKDHYKILGLEEGTSLEAITARWMELKKQLQSDSDNGEEARKTLKEINEAYRMLKNTVPPLDKFDAEGYLRKSIKTRETGRKKLQRRRIILSSGILVICLVIAASLFILKGPQETIPPKSITQADPNRKTGGSTKETFPIPPSESRSPVMVAEVVPQEPSKAVISEPPKPASLSKESPAAFISPPPPPLKTAPRVDVIKLAPQEPSNRVLSESARPAPTKRPPLKTAPPVEAARVVPREPRKAALPETYRPAPAAIHPLKAEPPVEAAKVAPQEPSKAALPEPSQPAPAGIPPLKAEPPVEAAKVALPEPSQPAPATIHPLKAEPPVEAAKVAPQEPSKAALPEPSQLALP